MVNLTVDSLNAWKEEFTNHQIVDVREAYEFEDANIGGINIPMDQVMQRNDFFKENTAYLFCCKTGKRAAAIAYMLERKLNLKNIYVLEGGVEAALSQTL